MRLWCILKTLYFKHDEIDMDHRGIIYNMFFYKLWNAYNFALIYRDTPKNSVMGRIVTDNCWKYFSTIVFIFKM